MFLYSKWNYKKKKPTFVACAPGYYGLQCNIRCIPGFYGELCAGSCHPKCSKEKCHHVYGCVGNNTDATYANLSGKRKLNDYCFRIKSLIFIHNDKTHQLSVSLMEVFDFLKGSIPFPQKQQNNSYIPLMSARVQP